MHIPEELRPLLVPIDSLTRWPGNAKLHDTEAIWESINENGFTDPVIVQRETNRIIAGNGRWETLAERGETHIPALFIDATDEQARRFLLIHNKSHETGYDETLLIELLDSLADSERGLAATGYTDSEYRDLLSFADDTPDLDKLADDLGDPGEEDFWPVLKFKVSPAVRDAFMKLTEAAADTEDPAGRLRHLMRTAGWDGL